MHKIDVDFDVYKALMIRRETENVTFNDVIRELVGLVPVNKTNVINKPFSKNSFISKGVEFPEGTEFRSYYKGQYFNAIVKNGYLVLNGKKFTSPSPAAVSITSNSVNGWLFWECRLPDRADWVTIKSLRDK